MGYAFISYSTKNQSLADSMRQLLRQNGIASWMAPADIPVGSKYAQVINRAIKDCACVVLLLSDAAQNSVWVAKEIERAVNYRKIIIPLQLEALVLNDEFEIYLSTYHVIALTQISSSSPEIKTILERLKGICGTTNEGALNNRQNTRAAQEEPAPSEKTQPAEEAQAYYKKGMRFYEQKMYGNAVGWFRNAAELGYAKAQFLLGECYYLGLGIDHDYNLAAEWYRKAAEQNYADAQHFLGECYLCGFGVKQDCKLAAEWYRKAAEQSHADAQYFLGYCYYYGKGVNQDYHQAVEWYRKAAEQGHADAQNVLGYCYYEGNGVKPDYSLAIEWYRKAANQGHSGAQNTLKKLGI